MSARFKVGDRITIAGTVTDVEDNPFPVGVVWDGATQKVWVDADVVAQAVIATTRAPWEVLREAAEIYKAIPKDYGNLLLTADELEAAARPPSLLEAAKQMLAALNEGFPERGLRDRLRNAVEVAKREAGQ